MAKYNLLPILVVMLFALAITSCSGSSADAPAKAVEAYWQAMADKDSTTLSSLTCADYEATALTNLASFQSVDLALKDLKCSTSSSTETSAEVTCQGALAASYGAEDTDFNLADFNFVIIKESGNWLICGEK